MLVAFYKSQQDRNVDCEISKFVDRIWIDSSGDLTCIRTFVVHVKSESPGPLTAVNMLVPFRQVSDLEDQSHTCLNSNYLFNNKAFSTGGFSIKTSNPAEKRGEISYDGFDVLVCTNNEIKSHSTPKKVSRIISVDFPLLPIEPGNFRLIRIHFKVTSILDEVFPKFHHFEARYFEAAECLKDYELLDVDNLEIPVNKIFNMDTKQGGVDIFLYLPPELKGTNFNSLTETTSEHLPNGTEAEKKGQKFIWRARAMIPEEVGYLKSRETEFMIGGWINDPFEMEKIRGDISHLRLTSMTAKKLAIWALIVGLSSFLVMLLISF